MLKFLWQINLRRLGRYFKKNAAAKLITAALFLLVLLAVAAGIYQFFYYGFLYLKNYPYFRPALMLYSFEIFFLLIGFLIWMGSVISLLFSLFKNRRSNFIMASPNFGVLPIYTLGVNLASSSWILLFVLAPALWAGEVVFHTGFWAFVLALLACLLVIVFSVLLAYVLILAVAKILMLFGKSGPKFFGLTVCMAILAFAVFFVVAAKVSRHDIIVILSTENLNIIQAPLDPVLQSFMFLPTSPAAQIITFTQTGELGKTAPGFAVLALLIVLELWLGRSLGKNFLPQWQSLAQSGQAVAHGQEPRRAGGTLKSSLLNSPFGALLYKERTQLFG